MMAFFVRDCVRCGVKNVQHFVAGIVRPKNYHYEIAGQCSVCSQLSVYHWEASGVYGVDQVKNDIGNTDLGVLDEQPVRIATTAIALSEHIPDRTADLFREANECRQMTWYEAAGAMYRKTVDVATKHIYATDGRLAQKNPADALRVRIKSLGEMKILDAEIVELADVAALDGNDATHDIDPYTAEEAEALEYLTMDLLDRLFVRPARLAAVKAKQIASGQRKDT